MLFKKVPTELDEVWSECIRMHENICAFLSNKGAPKEIWLRQQKYDFCKIASSCFFCQYDDDHNPNHLPDPARTGCPSCPGVLVEPGWTCMNVNFAYGNYDGKFVIELKRLDEIRKAAK